MVSVFFSRPDFFRMIASIFLRFLAMELIISEAAIIKLSTSSPLAIMLFLLLALLPRRWVCSVFRSPILIFLPEISGDVNKEERIDSCCDVRPNTCKSVHNVKC